MASTTVKPYPHVQINVKDNSIASVNIVEILPVHRPIYVMRTQEGPVGVPKWCNTYTEAVSLFGEETFNPANEIYFSKAAQYLLNTMTYNGAFIVRYLPEDSAIAKYVLFGRVTKKAAITQYEYQNGQRKLVYDPMQLEWIDAEKMDDTKWVLTSDTTFPTDGKKRYYTREGEGTAYDPYVYTIADYSALLGEAIPANTYYEGTAVTEEGVELVFGARETVGTEANDNLAPKAITNGYEFPLFVFQAKYAGAYGNDIAFKLFYTDKSNDSADVATYGTLFYNIGFARREYDSTTVNAVADIYGRENASFAANPETVNPDSGASMGVDYVLDKGFSDSTHILPVDFFPYTSNFNGLGLCIAAFESDDSINGYDTSLPIGKLTAEEKAAIKAVYFGTDSTAEQKEIVAGLTFGYKVNSVSCVGITGIAYDHAVMGAAQTGFVKADLTSSATIFLGPAEITKFIGSDGTFVADDVTDEWSTDDKAMYQFCKMTLPVLKDQIIESLHYPFTHIFDLGFSIKTKKAILQFLDARDDFMAIMSSQVLMSDGSGRSVPVTLADCNDQAADEANVETLRSYALLMRESVLYGTDCMRAAIYCHTGILASGTYVKPVPFTYWSAMQYAQYGNLTYMKQSEPRGLPNSYNLLFKEWNWNNYRADAQSRVWDAGANYVQYADMTRIFYPALRTVYRATTSVLVDEWFVDAVIYAKYVCKRAWAKFSGRNDSAAVLQAAIKQYLDKELSTLFNNKYTFTTSVYQTADELELGYIQHVKLSITSPATMRVLDVDIEVNREGFTAEE